MKEFTLLHPLLIWVLFIILWISSVYSIPLLFLGVLIFSEKKASLTFRCVWIYLCIRYSSFFTPSGIFIPHVFVLFLILGELIILLFEFEYQFSQVPGLPQHVYLREEFRFYYP